MGKLWIGISTHQHNLIGSALDLDFQSDFPERERERGSGGAMWQGKEREREREVVVVPCRLGRFYVRDVLWG